MTEQQLQQLVEQLSMEKFSWPFKHRAYFNARLKTTGGRYMLHTHDIEINKKLYDHFGLQELHGIILHELCHYHLHLQGRGYKHRDNDFRQLLKQVGAPRFCSSLNVEKKKMKIYVYRCINCGQQYNRKRRLTESKYRCSKCDGPIKFYTIVE